MEWAIISIVLFIVVLIAWLLSISMLIDAGKSKGYSFEKTGLLWFVGIFASPIVLGLYINALADVREDA